MNTIIERYHDVTARIEAAARKSSRAASDITLVAVSKTYSADDIEPVLQLGLPYDRVSPIADISDVIFGKMVVLFMFVVVLRVVL